MFSILHVQSAREVDLICESELSIMLVTLLISLILLLAVWKVLEQLNRKYFILSLVRRIKTKDGSPLESIVFVLPGKTIFGNNFDAQKMTPLMIFRLVRETYAKAGGKNFIIYLIVGGMYNAVRAEEADEILQSTKLITKGFYYEYLKPFLGDGLLISTDKKWHFRKKLLTPAFHFIVLQSFLDIFKKESVKLINVLEKKLDVELELNQIIPQFTLNTVCETALGVNLDDMTESKQYRKSIHALEEIMVERFCNPFLYFDSLFKIFGNYRKHVDNLKIAHDFSSRIIEKKREQFKNQQSKVADDFGRKKRYAMLDTLLGSENEGLIDHEGICDEVNTFMFEGYDTTSTCLTFTLLLLSLHEDVQERVFEELQHLSENNEDLSVFDFNKLVYLECVIKESLRLYPPVPYLGRVCTEECVVNNLIMPKGSQITVHVFDVMRDPRHFPNPLEFQPDRFLPENSVNRHPFAFIPFSAGPRNCIGQKFAILEMKVLLVNILRNFKLMPATRLEDIILEYGIVLRSQKNIKVKFVRRQKT